MEFFQTGQLSDGSHLCITNRCEHKIELCQIMEARQCGYVGVCDLRPLQLQPLERLHFSDFNEARAIRERLLKSQPDHAAQPTDLREVTRLESSLRRDGESMNMEWPAGELRHIGDVNHLPSGLDVEASLRPHRPLRNLAFGGIVNRVARVGHRSLARLRHRRTGQLQCGSHGIHRQGHAEAHEVALIRRGAGPMTA